MGFGSVKSYVEAINDEGKLRRFSFRKTPAQVTVQGIWTDLSMSPGNPVPNYYASEPLVAALMDGREGLFHGGDVLPSTKHLKEMLVLSSSATGLPLRLVLCDYLLYYPFVDQGGGTQDLDNSVGLPRYNDGAGGAQIMAVLVAAQTGGSSFQLSYTNQDGVAGRLTPLITFNTATSTGAIATTAQATNGCAGPFLPLQAGDTGVMSIEQFIPATSDVGLVTLVLVKPLADFVLREQTAPVEVDYLRDRPSLPTIQDGAYLNLLALPMGSLSGVSLHGTITTIWS